MNLIFFLEELSAREMLKGLLRRMLPPDTEVSYVLFDGKRDLQKQLVPKLKRWRKPNSKFVILCDQDSSDCHELKQSLVAKCREAGKPEAVVRIVCRELESWYFGDLAAVGRVLERPHLVSHSRKRKYRIPDAIHRPSWELRKITDAAYQKVASSRAIGPELSVDGNRSHSFRVFVQCILDAAPGT